jgi:cytosine/adenosine deaminase-related metal-dependent hydrolase
VRSPRPLFVKDALLVSFFPPRVEEGHVRAEGGRILEAGPSARPRGGDEIVDRWGKPVLPGFVNADHRLLAAAAGVRFPPREALDRETRESEVVHALAGLSLLDALACGATTVVHHPAQALSEEAIEALSLAFREVGVRGIVSLPVEGEGGALTLETLRRLEAERIDPDLRLALGVRACAAREDREALARARAETGVSVHVDLLGESEEVGGGLLALEEAGLLREGALLFGPVERSSPAVRRALERGARLAVAARSQAAGRQERAPLEALAPRVALGTGGVDGDLTEEARFAALGCVAEGASFDVVSLFVAGWELARSWFDLPFGSIEPGAPADLLFVDALPAVPLRPDSLGSFLLDLSARRIESVYVDGRRLYHRREPVFPIEREALVDRARAVLVGS